MTLVRRFAEREHSAALDRLTSSISAMMKLGARTDESPFTKGEEFDLGLVQQVAGGCPVQGPRHVLSQRGDVEGDREEGESRGRCCEHGAGEDPFMKVKGSITELINRLLEETSSEAPRKRATTRKRRWVLRRGILMPTLRSTHPHLCPDLLLWTSRSRRFNQS